MFTINLNHSSLLPPCPPLTHLSPSPAPKIVEAFPAQTHFSTGSLIRTVYFLSYSVLVTQPCQGEVIKSHATKTLSETSPIPFLGHTHGG